MSDKNLKGWNEIPDGGVIPQGGTSKDYLTGSWKTSEPKINFDKCVHCLLCWWYCPDTCIGVKDEKISGIDLDHCKGCGICADVCPPKVKAIQMTVPQHFEDKAEVSKNGR